MKKLTILALAAIVFAACGGHKNVESSEETDTLKTFEQRQIESSIKIHLDSLATELGNLKRPEFLTETDGKFQLTKQEKQVKPTYLLDASIADEAVTLAEKYRVLAALGIDRRIARLYEMPEDAYNKSISKLLADIDDPSFKNVKSGGDLFEASAVLYQAMEENGRINYYWQMAASSLVEEIYFVSQNQEKFLSTFTDETASNVSFRVNLLIDALNHLSQYDSEISPVASVMAPLEQLNATTVEELKEQMDSLKSEIEGARKALIK